MNVDVEQNIEPSEEQLELDVGAVQPLRVGKSIDGHFIPLDRLGDVGRNHFAVKVEQGNASKWHEVFSCHGAALSFLVSGVTAAGSLSFSPLMQDWKSAAALGLSAPILYVLAKGEGRARRDYHRVDRCDEHYKKYGDPAVWEAAGVRVDGLVDVTATDEEREEYRKEYCLETRVSDTEWKTAHEHGGVLTISKNDPSLEKSKKILKNVGHEFAHLAKNLDVFGSDLLLGYKNLAKQVGMVHDQVCRKGHIKLVNSFDKASDFVSRKKWQLLHEVPHVAQQALYGELKVPHISSPFKEKVANDNDRDLSDEEKNLEHKLHLNKRDRKEELSTMALANYSFIAEHGFVGLEMWNGARLLQEAFEGGDGLSASFKAGAWGVSHIACALAALSPTQEVVHANEMALYNYDALKEREFELRADAEYLQQHPSPAA